MGLFSRNEDKKTAKILMAEEKKNAKLEKELINEEKIKTGKSTIKILNDAKNHFEDNEELIDYVSGVYDAKLLNADTKISGVLIATNKRVLAYGKKMTGFNLETIDYNKISSVEYNKGSILWELKIHTSGNVIKVETGMHHGTIELIKIIKDKINIPSQVVTAAAQEKSLPDQLKELKELVDMDILTQSEFDAKKKQILGL
ncbi:Hypothetical protein Tpal_461 [Trichococcus palustris]|uniref:BBSome complex member BBS5 PH domain-containing protein n=1 Tax=Trichococcus palustris TaxID=140314 RepID=A0A143Y9C9_9LACT|nr:PH domain-containing protein [Trichococcus palustris]CZQ83564.1 Hypothetical protein Tpal_461 [Trichococcus palustris]SFK70108.1 Short C-terminal domain-containing protein [Trichococcus palustris]